jgi:hypothetical protein
MTALGTLLLGLLASLALLAAGAAVALHWRPARRPASRPAAGAADPADDDGPDTGPLLHVALALGWGFGLVPLLAFAWALFTRTALTATVTLTAAALVTAAALGLWAARGRHVPVALRAGWRRAAPVLVAAALVGAVFLVRHDRSLFFHDSCINRVALQVMHVSDRPVDVLTSNEEDQRLGNTAVVASFVALYGAPGFRSLYGFLGVAMALGGFLLGARALGRRPWGWFVLVALPLNPYVLSIGNVDENLLALGYGALFLPLLLRRDVPWASAGALFGLVVLMRHVLFLSLPAALWALWVYRGPRLRALALSVTTFVAATFICLAHHHLALGHAFRTENWGQVAPLPHRLIGDYPGMLQWPLAESVVRTPGNPLPTFLMWPAYLADHLGLVLFAAALLGVVALLVRRGPAGGRLRREGVFWLLWFGPTYGFLSLQENWDVPNKMGIVTILFAAVAVWAAAGLEAVRRRPAVWGSALVAVAALTWVGVVALRDVQVPADERYWRKRPDQRREDPAYVAARAVEVTTVAPWPDYGRLWAPAPLRPLDNLRDLVDELARPALRHESLPYARHAGAAVDPDGAPVWVELDLSRRLFDRPDPWLRALPADDRPLACLRGGCPPGVGERDEDGDGVADLLLIDLTQPGPPVAVTDLALPAWTDRPLTILTSEGRAAVSGLVLVFDPWPADAERFRRFHDTHARAAAKLVGADPASWDAPDKARRVAATGPRLRVRLLPGPLNVAETLNADAQRYFVWLATPRAAAPVTVEGPYDFLHN